MTTKKKDPAKSSGGPRRKTAPPPRTRAQFCSRVCVCSIEIVQLTYGDFFSLMLHFDDAKSHPRKKKTKTAAQTNIAEFFFKRAFEASS